METSYNWNRRWVLQGTRKDQETNFSMYAQQWPSTNPQASSYLLEELPDTPVIILLGEPGIGKSSEITSYSERIEEEKTQDIWIFEDYPPSNFTEFFNQPQFEPWRTGQSKLILFIDAFDESSHATVDLGRELVRALSRLSEHLDNIYLRIACRTADWSEDTSKELKDLFGKNSLLTIELDALSELEIISAAKQTGIDPYNFLAQVKQQALTALTLKPITLFDLLKEYQKNNGVLPQSRNDLYLSMCHRLCEEHNSYHDGKNRQNNFTTNEIFNEASRLATIMLTTRQLTLWTRSSTVNLPDGAIPIRKLHNEKEKLITATLHTGFFVSKGHNLLGWAHLSYAEYLAAVYMNRKMTLPQIKSLLVHPDGKKIVPQLREVAAWITTMNPAFFDFVIDLDPEMLIQSDLIVEDIHRREKLAEILLESYDSGILIDSSNNHIRYPRLNHPNLASQIADFMQNPTRNEISQQVAIRLIYTCELQDAADRLVEMVLDPKLNLKYSVRSHLAYVIACIGREQSKLLLKPLTLGSSYDTNDELKGAGLIATWPKYLTSQELFEALTPRKKNNFHGYYQIFLRREIIDNLSITDLPMALNWATNFIRKYADVHHRIDSIMQDLIDAIVYKSWINFDVPDIIQALAELVLVKVDQYQPLFGNKNEQLKKHYQEVIDDLMQNEEKRHILLIETIKLVNPDFHFFLFKYSIPLLLDTDLSWLLNLLEKEDSSIPRDTLLSLIKVVFRNRDINHMTEMTSAMEHIEDLREKFQHYFYVEINSAYANELQQLRRQKKDLEAENKELEGKRQERLIDPPPIERLEKLLQQCEQGEIKEWWQTNIWLVTDEYGCGHESYGDIRQMPNWEKLDKDTQAKVISLGVEFIFNFSLDPKIQIEQYTTCRPAHAAYRMLFLLFDTLGEIEASLLEKWIPAIITFPNYYIRSEYQTHNSFLAMVYKSNRQDFKSCLKEFIEHWHNPNFDIGSTVEYYLLQLNNLFDDGISEILFEYLDNPQIQPNHYRAILNYLLSNHLPSAYSRAGDEFQKLYDRHHILLNQIPLLCALQADNHPSKIHLARLIQAMFKEFTISRTESARFAANILTSPVHDDWWRSIWELIQMDVDFGREVIENIAGIYDDRRVTQLAPQLPEDIVANLYLWVAEQYPYEEDPDLFSEPGFRTVTTRDQVRDWRNSILEYLAERGTNEAFTQLERIAQTYPDLYQLKQLRKHLSEHLYKNSWHPPQIDDLLSLIENSDKRFIQTGSQLLDLVIESLERLQKRLQGETPSAVDLWNIDKNSCRPKDENALSNYVKRHLEQDLEETGIIVNREVEIRRKEGGEGAAAGEIIDLEVNAVTKSPDDNSMKQLVVLIEVKGNWHRELKTAMQTQLTERYFHNNDKATDGLYLVGWFNCKQWDKDDSRYENAYNNNEFDNLLNELKAQAEALSGDYLDVRAFILDTSLRDTS